MIVCGWPASREVTCAQDIKTFDCKWGYTDTVKESALKGDWQKKSHAAPGK